MWMEHKQTTVQHIFVPQRQQQMSMKKKGSGEIVWCKQNVVSECWCGVWSLVGQLFNHTDQLDKWWNSGGAHTHNSSTPIGSAWLVGNTEDSGNTAKADSCTRSDVFGCLGHKCQARVELSSGRSWKMCMPRSTDQCTDLCKAVEWNDNTSTFSQKGAVLMNF